MTEADLAEAMFQTAQIERGHWRMAEMIDGAAAPPSAKAGGRKPGVSVEAYLDCAAQGMTISQTAAHLGVTDSAAQHMRRTYKITFKHGQRGRRRKA